MKKLVAYILTILFLLSLTACNAKVPNNVGNISNTAAQTAVTYTKEFSYLPASSNMEFQSISQPDQNQMSTARYLIKNTTTDKVLNEYADNLQKDGWTIKDKNPNCITAKKDKHMAVLFSEQTDDNVLLSIGSN